jgi:uncharacterized protein involved in response to NO
MTASKTEPYRVFFPLGILFGLAGVSIWPLYYFHITAGYSGRAHALAQATGFLFAFISGFLLTAAPRFTGTELPSMPTQYVLAAMLIVSVVAAEVQAFAISTGAFAAANIMLGSLVVRRFARRRQNPPPTFVLIGLGLLAGGAGALVNLGVASALIPAFWDLLGKRLLTEGMMMLLVLGVGGFLGPRLLGFAAVPTPVAPGATAIERPPIAAPVDFRWAVPGVTILTALVAEYGYGVPGMAFVRAAVVTAVLFKTLRPWRRPAVRSTLSWCVWTASWLIVASVWLVAFAPRYRIDFLHVLFVGGFSLLILAVGTRVTLSHGGHDLRQERRSWPLRIGLTMGLIAMLARIGAPFAPDSYFEHLAIAGLFWMGGMLAWGVYLLKTMRG